MTHGGGYNLFKVAIRSNILDPWCEGRHSVKADPNVAVSEVEDISF